MLMQCVYLTFFPLFRSQANELKCNDMRTKCKDLTDIYTDAKENYPNAYHHCSTHIDETIMIYDIKWYVK